MPGTHFALGDNPVPVRVTRFAIALQIKLIRATADFLIQVRLGRARSVLLAATTVDSAFLMASGARCTGMDCTVADSVDGVVFLLRVEVLSLLFRGISLLLTNGYSSNS